MRKRISQLEKQQAGMTDALARARFSHAKQEKKHEEDIDATFECGKRKGAEEFAQQTDCWAEEMEAVAKKRPKL